VLLVPVKLLLSSGSISTGWRATYFPTSYLGRYQATFFSGFSARPYRIENKIDYEGSNFGLYFLNDADRYGGDPFHAATELPRDFEYPLTVRWTGYFWCPAAGVVALDASARGLLRIEIDKKTLFEGRASAPLRVTTPGSLLAGLHEIVATYSKPSKTDPGIHISDITETGVLAPLPVIPRPLSPSTLRRNAFISHGTNAAGLLGCLLLAWIFADAYWPLRALLKTRIIADPVRMGAFFLFSVFLAVGFVKMLDYRHRTFPLSPGNDPLAYESMARAALFTGPLMRSSLGPPTAFYFYPLYSYALAVAHLLFGEDFSAVIILNFCCIASGVLLAWQLAFRRMGRAAAFLGLAAFGVFTKLHLFRYGDMAYTDNLFFPLVLVALILCIRAVESEHGSAWTAAGVGTALAAATRPSFLLFGPCFLLAVLAWTGGGLRQRLRRAAFLTAGFAAGVFPFTLRNWLVTKKFVLLVNSYVMVPYFLFTPEEVKPDLSHGGIPSFAQSLIDGLRIVGDRPAAVLKLELRKLMFTLGVTQVGPPGMTRHTDLLILTLLFGLAIALRRIPRGPRFVLVVFGVSHLLAMIVAAPWTYGYKTILPLHATFLLGATFLLTPREERAVARAAVSASRESGRPKGSVSVILPTLNERDSIRGVVEGFFATGAVSEVLVINNNAVPGTSEALAGTDAREIHEERQGYGWAIRRGLAEARGDWLVVSEPDGTFLPGDIFKLLAYAADFDVVYGSRTVQQLIWKGANMGLFLRWGNWVVAKYLQFLFNARSLTDVGCTMRLIHRDVARSLAPHFKIGGSEFGPEMMILSLRAGYRVIQIPINYLPRVGASAVTGDPVKAFFLGLRMIWLITTSRLRGARPERKLEPEVLAASPQKQT